MLRARPGVRLAVFAAAVPLLIALPLPVVSGQTAPSDKPETPFKLATFEAGGRERAGMVVGDRIFDIAGAGAHLVKTAGVRPMALPSEMRALIEGYEALAPRLYQIANMLKGAAATALPFGFDIDKVSIKAPIKYPYNLLAAAANYKSHAQGMGMQVQVDPDKDAPFFFAKSPRSCIADPGQPFVVPAGRERIDWEGELAIVIGKRATKVPRESAHDYVFGYSIMYDVSDRGGQPRGKPMFQTDWYSGKSRDGAAPFGPFIVPKEFLPNHASLRIVTKVNGVVKQDGNTRDMIYDEARQIAFLTSIMTLWPGDVISTGTPEGTGAERKEFLKPGDVVTIEIDGIGTLTTPIAAARQ